MSATLAPPRPAAAGPPPAPPAAGPPLAPSPPAPVGRFTRRDALWFAAFAALLGLCMVRWVGLLANAPIVGALLFALGCAAVSAGLAVIPWPRVRYAAAVVAAVALVGIALLISGLPLWLLDPRDWGTLFPGLSDGVSALPGVTVPYKGEGDWVRITIFTGGGLLVVAATVAAALGRRALALVLVVVLFAVPAIEIASDHPWLVGAGFSLPLCAALLAPRLPGRLVLPAVALVVGAILAGMAAAPLLDGDGPVIDVQHLASRLEPEQAEHFNWSHGYGPLDWPRDGRELLRITSDRAAYWKAEDLDLFDGTRWRSDGSSRLAAPSTEGVAAHPQWRQRVKVTIKGMQTRDFIAPGQALSISRAPRQPVNTRPGGFTVAADDSPLKENNAYVADSYVPRPRAAQLRAAAPDYPSTVAGELTMLTPAHGQTGQALIRFPAYGTAGAPTVVGPGVSSTDAVSLLDGSGYGRMYELARELASGVTTQYGVVQAVQAYLANPRFVYDEKVVAQKLALPAFLFQTHAGYCQHFSGAMALLLRMAGVPARVSSGFTTGTADAKRGEYVVRDTDAHSWVEVWFAGIGWVTFDPTPAAAPALAESSGASTAAGAVPSGPRPRGATGDGADLGPLGGEATAGTAGGGGGASPAPWIALAIAAVAVAALVRAGWRRRRRARLAHADEDPDVAELQRALRRSGRPVARTTTLRALEQRFAGQPAARDYVRAVAARRYGAGGTGPTAAQRRALRAALGDGLGLRGRIRALWALPPRPLA